MGADSADLLLTGWVHVKADIIGHWSRNKTPHAPLLTCGGQPASTGWCFSVDFIGCISRHRTNFRFATHTPEYIRALRISSGEYLTIGLSLSLGSNSTET